MIRYALAFATLMASPAICQEIFTFKDWQSTTLTTEPLVSITVPEIFRLGPGGCLRGPITITNPNTGVVIFQLLDGVEYPAGCADKSAPNP